MTAAPHPSPEAWLKQEATTASLWSRLSTGAGALAAVATIVLFALLARCIADWVGGRMPPVATLWYVVPVLVLIRSVFLALKDWAGAKAGLAVRRRVRGRLLERLAQLGPLRAGIGNDGQLSTTVLEQVDALDAYYARYLPQTRLAAIVPLLIAAAVAPRSWLAAVIFLVTAPLIPLFMVLVGRGAAAASERQAVALGVLGGRFLDLLRGAPTLRLLGRAETGERWITHASEEYRKRTMGVLRLAFLSSAVLELFSSIAIAMVALYLGLSLLDWFHWGHYGEDMWLEDALFILMLAPEFYMPLRQLGAEYHSRAQAIGAAQAIMRVEAVPGQWRPAVASVRWPQPVGGIRLEFDAVTLRYPDGRIGIEAVSFVLNPGERVALVGESGAGKSSLLNLVLGFAAPNEGRILANGLNLTTLERASWWRVLAWMGQRPEWFRGSLRENLTLGAEGYDDTALATVLRQAGLGGLLASLPDGLDTVLGEGGRGLSGGQLQRLALARALLRDAPLWLLDEPTAQLDADTSAALRAELARASQGRSVLLATHDRAHLEWVDRVLVLEQGRLVEQGAPQSLLARADSRLCRLFRELEDGA